MVQHYARAGNATHGWISQPNVWIMLALSLSTAKNIAIIVVGVLLVAAIITAKLVASVTKKAIALLVLGALALGVWTQRQSLQSCADKVKSDAASGEVSCTFFGTDIHVKAPVPGG